MPPANPGVPFRRCCNQQILAVCSAESSCSLIENVGCGCSVANADKSVKKAANEFTDSNENKGVEHIIKKYF